MAVYEGARPRSSLFPRRRLDAPLIRRQALVTHAPAMPRRSSRVTLRARKRPRFFGVAIGLIVVAFLLSFFSLVPVSYTHLTLPTNREVQIPVVAVTFKTKKK